MEQNYDIDNKTECPKVDCRKKSCKCGPTAIFLPAALGDDSAGSEIAPKNGAYCDAIVTYEANGHIYFYSKEGIPVKIESNDGGGGSGGTKDFNELNNRPRYNNVAMTGNTNIPEIPTAVSQLQNDSGYQTESDVQTAISGKQDTLTAGDNITIVGNVISATGGGGGGEGVKTLTSEDYNWNAQTQSTENPDCIGQWLLDDGYYVLADALSVCGSPDELSASAENGSLLVSSTTDTGQYGEYITKKCTWLQYGSMFQRVYNYNNSRENGWFYESFYQWPTSGDISGIIQGAIRTDYGDYTPDEDTWGSDGQLLLVIDTEQRTVRMFVCAGGDWDETQQKTVYYWYEIPVNPITPNN